MPILKNFFVPTRYAKTFFDIEKAKVAAIIPTHKPERITEKLVHDLVRWNPQVRVYVVDDSTPAGYGESERVFEAIAAIPQVTLLRTPTNALKAGALNYALTRIYAEKEEPDVIITLDDDVVVNASTVQTLVAELMSYEHLGAACSQCHVLNKNKNLLTRLQGLEYVGFNAIRLADEGFFRGPLVMHGMLTAFRTKALKEVGKFAERHLIEDYEITARLKARGWSVKSALDSHAWTFVPERFSTLWRQRTRWLYGGITVVTRAKRPLAVLQDLIGHGVFFATVIVIALLILFRGEGRIAPLIAELVILLSLFQFVLWFAFQLWLMRLYKEKDTYDWILRGSVLPEFVYSNMLTVVQVGAYLFFLYNASRNMIRARNIPLIEMPMGFLGKIFRACGYTESWTTRAQ